MFVVVLILDFVISCFCSCFCSFCVDFLCQVSQLQSENLQLISYKRQVLTLEQEAREMEAQLVQVRGSWCKERACCKFRSCGSFLVLVENYGPYRP